MKTLGTWLVAGAPLLAAAVACSDNGELFGTRAEGGESGAGAAPGGTAGTTPAAGGAAGSVAGQGGASGTAGRAGAGAGPNGGASGSAATSGSGGTEAGAGGTNGGSGAGAGSSGESGAGAGGAAGGPATCPTGCERSPTASACTDGGEVWECPGAYDHQEMLDAGCTDLATGLPRYCCPVEPYADCAPEGDCADVLTEIECDARPTCHSVYLDPNNCDCLGIGCCAQFAACADGGQANCDNSNVECDTLTPYCESPVYVVSYVGFCYEGCVKPADCAP